MDETTRSRAAAGTTLIVVGLALFGMQYLGDLGRSLTLTALAGLCIAGYLYSRSRFLVTAGGVLAGLAIGSFSDQSFSLTSDFHRLGLGIGFLLVWGIPLAYERRSTWWPLVTGAVLVLLSFNAWRPFRLFLMDKGWPLILVIVGVLMLLGTVGRGKARASSPDPDA